MSVFANIIINFVVNLILSVSFSIILIVHLSKKTINKFIKGLSLIMINLNLFLVLSLISDIFYNHIITGDTTITDKEKKIIESLLGKCYQIIFFVNSLFPPFIPFIISYEESGEFTKKKKIKDAFKKFIFGLSFLLIFGGVYFILNIFKNYTIAYVLIICLIQMNSFLAFVFIGFSIVKIPKKMFLRSNMEKNINYYEFKAKIKKEELEDSLKELQLIKTRCILTLKYINSIKDSNINEEENKNNENNENNENKINTKDLEEQKNMIQSEEYIKEMISVFNNDEDLKNEENIENEEKEKNNNDSEDNMNEKIEETNKNKKEKKKEPIMTYKDLVNENRQLKEFMRNKERIKIEIQKIYNEWYKLKSLSILIKIESNEDKNEDIDTLNLSPKNSITLSMNEENFIPLNSLSPRKIKFFKKANKPIYLLLGFFFIFSGIMIVLSEISISFGNRASIFGIMTFIKNMFIINIFFIVIILFIFFLAINAMIKLKYLKKKNGIFLDKKTDQISLLVICSRLSAVSIPICLNVIKMITHDEKKFNQIDFKTILGENFGKKMKISAFDSITPYIPLFLIIVIIIFSFNIIGRICKKRRKLNFKLKSEKREEFIQDGKKYLFEIYEKENKCGNNNQFNKIFNEIKDGDKLDENDDNKDNLLNSLDKE